MKLQYFIIGISTSVFLLFYFLIPVTTIEFGCHSKEPKLNEATEGFAAQFTTFAYTRFLLNGGHIELDHIICTPG